MNERIKEPPYKDLGQFLTNALGEHTQQWLANQLYVRAHTVSEYLGGVKRPSSGRLAHIAVILELDPIQLGDLAGWDATDVLEYWEKATGQTYDSSQQELLSTDGRIF